MSGQPRALRWKIACLVVSLVFSPLEAPVLAQPSQSPAPTALLASVEQAVLKAANDLLAKTPLPDDPTAKVRVVIDPLVDGNTGAQTIESRRMGERIAALVKTRHPRFIVERLSKDILAQKPHLLIGTVTPINSAGQSRGPRDTYRIWLTLADLRTGKIISKGSARADITTADLTPVRFFGDSPGWTQDPSIRAYIDSCQETKIGDTLKVAYLARLETAAVLSDAISAYDAGRYAEALDLFQAAAQGPGADQLRVYNGLYLANAKLKRTEEAEKAFAQLVAFGLKSDRLAVKFLFEVNTARFLTASTVTAPYAMWLRQIAERAKTANACLEVIGHASPTASASYNDRLSLRRATAVKAQLTSRAPDLQGRLTTQGMGFRENLVGTGRDDDSDALDRRVEFKVRPCP